MAETDLTPEITLVIPFYNEEGNVSFVINDAVNALSKLYKHWELIAVDDASTDNTYKLLTEIAKNKNEIKLVHFTNNQGQGCALFTGFKLAKAPLIAMMDGDRQNLASDIGLLVSELNENDMIVGIRKNRDDSKLRILTSKIANYFRRLLLKDKLHDAGCALKVFRSEVRSSFYNIKMLNPFMPALAIAKGYKVKEIAITHRARTEGKSKYGFRAMLLRPILDLIYVLKIVHFSKK
jgi:glycosyltransferase involved in cell wall biosynthesis